MPDYEIDRGWPYVDPITAERAAQIFEAAKLDPDADLDGTLEDGFWFTIGEPGEPHIVRAKVRPVRSTEPD